MTEVWLELDVVADLNAEDGDGLGWSTLSEACDADRVRPGAMLLVGNESAKAVVRVVAVDDDGQIHFSILPARPQGTVTCSIAPPPDAVRTLSSARCCGPGQRLFRAGPRPKPGRRVCRAFLSVLRDESDGDAQQ